MESAVGHPFHFEKTLTRKPTLRREAGSQSEADETEEDSLIRWPPTANRRLALAPSAGRQVTKSVEKVKRFHSARL